MRNFKQLKDAELERLAAQPHGPDGRHARAEQARRQQVRTYRNAGQARAANHARQAEAFREQVAINRAKPGAPAPEPSKPVASVKPKGKSAATPETPGE